MYLRWWWSLRFKWGFYCNDEESRACLRTDLEVLSYFIQYWTFQYGIKLIFHTQRILKKKLKTETKFYFNNYFLIFRRANSNIAMIIYLKLLEIFLHWHLHFPSELYFIIDSFIFGTGNFNNLINLEFQRLREFKRLHFNILFNLTTDSHILNINYSNKAKS